MLELLYDLMGVAEEDGPRALVEAARRAQRHLPPLVLSLLAEQSPQLLGDASRDELRRARVRRDRFEELAATLTGLGGGTVLKGPVLSRFYPPAAVRAYGDIDLVLPDEAALWRAAKWLVRSVPVERVDVSLVGGAHPDVVVAFEWASTDPLVDPPYHIDLSLVAFPGDLAAVPARPVPPGDDALACLLAIAEERFGRAFHPRDACDVVQLDPAMNLPAEQVVAVAADYRLAPELAELLTYVQRHVALPRLGAALAGLEAATETELRQRAEYRPAEAAATVPEVLDAGGVAHGYPLEPPAARADLEVAQLVPFSHGHLCRTPIGDHLMTTDSSVSLEAYEAALLARADLGSPVR